jgi:hypothetical protein
MSIFSETVCDKGTTFLRNRISDNIESNTKTLFNTKASYPIEYHQLQEVMMHTSIYCKSYVHKKFSFIRKSYPLIFCGVIVDQFIY